MNTFFFTVAKMQETSLTLDDGCKYLSNLNVMTDIKNSRNIITTLVLKKSYEWSF